MKKIIVLLFAFISFLSADSEIKKVVIDFTSGDLAVFEKKILSGIPHHKLYFENRFEELEVAIVIHGDAYKLFVKNLQNTTYKKEQALVAKQAEYEKRLTSLVETYSVEIFMCDVGRKKHKIAKEDLYEFVKIVPNSTIGLIDKQNEGYAYIPVAN
ncbi:MAG: DsrE family protein [Sulfurimonas sp.]